MLPRFVAEPVRCSSCEQDRDWRYQGSFYTTVDDLPRLLPDPVLEADLDGDLSGCVVCGAHRLHADAS